MYDIQYQSIDKKFFKSKASARNWLKEEEKQWSEFIDSFYERNPKFPWGSNNNIQIGIVKKSFETLLGLLDDPDAFNTTVGNRYHGTRVALPPPSDTLIGQIVLSSNAKEDYALADSVFTAFLVNEGGFQHISTNPIVKKNNAGQQLIPVLKIFDTLDVVGVSQQKYGALLRKNETLGFDLEKIVGEAEKQNSRHAENLAASLNNFELRAEKIFSLHVAKSSRVKERFESWKLDCEQKAKNYFRELEKRANLFESERRSNHEVTADRFSELEARYHKHLEYQRPVYLWASRARMHRENALAAKFIFWGLVFVSIVFAASVSIYAGGPIAESFNRTVCDRGGCEEVFFFKGPLIVSSLLLVTSLLLWLIRLQNKIHLSERHLYLDAQERTAFAETYLALRSNKDVGEDNEAIVLGSLFRPTQDGIIKDDDGGLDVSMAAVIAKQLAGKN